MSVAKVRAMLDSGFRSILRFNKNVRVTVVTGCNYCHGGDRLDRRKIHAPTTHAKHFLNETLTMQNRFTIKDFFYMLIGLVICLLLFFNMIKTDHEVEALANVDQLIKNQNATLSNLDRSIESLRSGIRITPDMMAGGGNSATNSGGNAGNGNGNNGSATPAGGDFSNIPEDEFQANAAERPSYEPAADIQFSGPANTINRRGLPQQWQVAPDIELPDDFASGDSLVITWLSDPQMLTPVVASDAYGTRVFWYVMEYLVHLDIDSPFPKVPGLARSWEVSEDGMELTFHLFENATFSDGKPVTADDVIFTWDLATNPKVDSAQERSYIEANVEKWEKIDRHTVKFTMKKPYFDAVGVCGNLLPIMPKHVYGQYDEPTLNEGIPELCVGSGPFVLEKWDRNDQIVLARNENYWGPKPALDRIVIRIIANELSNLQEYRAGNVDLITPTAEQWVENADSPEIQDRGQTILYYTPRNGYQWLGYNQNRPIFQDKRTRQALTMLLDRRAIIDNLYFGLGLETTGPFFPLGDQYDDTIEPWPYDPERAKVLLAEVGWEDSDGDGILDMDLDGDGENEPFEFTFLCPSGLSFYERLQRFCQQSWREAGINVNLDLIEWTVFVDRLNERDFDLVSLIWSGGDPENDPYQIWHSSSIADKGSNLISFNNPEVDRLIEEARREQNYEKRQELWKGVHRIIHEEQPYTFLFAAPARGFLDKRFKNVKSHDYRLLYSEYYVPADQQKR